MTTELRTLRVSAELDTTKYVAGANQVVGADKAMSAAHAGATQAATQLETKISQSGDVLARLSRQYVDGYASAQRMASAVNQLSRGFETGKVSMAQASAILDGIAKKYGTIGSFAEFASRGQMEFANAIAATNARLSAQAAAATQATVATTRLNVAGNQNRRMSGMMAQGLSYQANDIATMALMGASPGQIAFSQGGQILQTLQMGEGGISGSLKEIKGSATAAASAIASFMGPVGLIATGFVAATAAASIFYNLTLDQGKSVEDILKQHKVVIDEIASAWPAATAAAKAYEDEAKRVPRSVASADALEQVKDEAEKLPALLDSLRRNLKMAGQDWQFSGIGKAGGAAFGTLAEEIQKGSLSAADLQDRVAQLRIDPALNDEAHAFAKTLQEAANQAAQLEKNLKGTTEAASHLDPRTGRGYGGDAADNLRKYLAGNSARMFQLQRDRATSVEGIEASNPWERARAAFNQEMSKGSDGSESPEVRRYRAETAALLILKQAQHDVAEAQRDRRRALDETIASAQLDIQLIGKTAGEQAALRLEFEKTAELREEAAKNGTKVQQQELDLIHEKAAALREAVDLQKQINLLSDIQFEREQLFRSSGEQQIASRLRGSGLGMDSQAADAMRWNQNFAELKDGVRGFFADFEQGLLQGDDIGKALGTAILNALNKVLDKALDQLLNSLANSIASALMGGGAPTAAFGTAGGFMEMLLSAGTGGGGSSVGRHVGGAGSGAGNFGGGVASALSSYIGGPAGTTRTGISLTELNVQGLTAKLSTQYADRFAGLFKDLDAAGYKIRSLGEGGYSFRNVAGTSNLSRHSFGEAVDINPRENPWSRNFKTDLPDNIGDIARKNGLKWGGEWNKPDTMHFQVDKSIKSFDKLSETTASVTKDIGGLGKVGADATQGLGQMTSALSQFPSAPGAFNGGAFGAGGGGLASLFGGGGGPDFTPWEMDYFSSHVGLWHEGGVVGNSGTRRSVDMRVFAGAPRYHNGGIAGDEVPAILRRGEIVSKDMGHLRSQAGGSKVNVTIINNAGVSVTTKETPQADGTVAIDVMVDRMVSEKLGNRGTATNNVLRRNFGARQTLKSRG